jgi:dipeptidyl aminopeptidase/acylaminoacyl peptidase
MREFGRYAVALSLTLASIPLTAQQNGGPVRTGAGGNSSDPIEAEGYITPPDGIAKLVGAPRMNNFTWGNPSPTRKYLVHVLAEEPTLATLGAKHYNLGGWQVDPLGQRSRTMTTRSATGYELLDWASGKTIKIEIPAGARASTYTSWSPDGSTFAYFAQFPDATHIYLADPATGKSRPLTKTSVNAANITSFEWTADGKSIVTVMVPENRGAEPKEPVIADAVRVRVNENTKLKTRNFFDLLENPHDKKLFEYFNTGQLAVIDVKSRGVTKIGEPGMIRSMDPSPDGKFVRVVYIDQPFSYVLQTNSFGTHELILDGSGKVLKRLAQREMQEGTSTDIDPDDQPTPPPGGGRGGPPPDSAKRSLTWHPFESGLMFFRSSTKDSLTRHRDDSTAAARARSNPANAAGARGAGGRANAGGGGRGSGDSTSSATRPDTMFLWQPPFNSSASPEFKPLYVTPGNGTISSVQFSDNGRIMFVTETISERTGTPPRTTSASHTDAIFLDENNARFTVLRGGNGGGANAGGRGGRGGRGGGQGGGGSPLLTKTGSRGQPVVLMSSDGKFVYTSQAAPTTGRGGRGAANADSTAGRSRPFVDRIEIRTGARSRVYESNATDRTESALTPLDDNITKGLATRQSRTQPPESFLVDVATRNATQLTKATDYWPNITNAIRKTTYARRSDGLLIRIRLTLPPDYREGTKLPALFWFYPSEYGDQDEYMRTLPDSVTGRTSTTGRGGAGGGGGRGGDNGGPGTFQSPGQRTMAFITAAGYALVEPDAPIVATEGKLPNDNYVNDLRNSLSAVITHLDTMRYVDRNKLAIGGHSYGGFSTMNALVHTDFFKAGIAGDGMYNRTLTPNGFQSERRDIYQGKEAYLAMSPFLFADQLSGAVLMYHSMEDQNVGTDPISSIRMYHALMGQGKNAALYMYPYEDHGPVARETNLDQWARWVAWLDKYVKNPEKKIAQ